MAYVSYFVSRKNKLTEVLKDTDNRVMALKLTLKNADADQVSAVLALLTESYRVLRSYLA